MAMDGLLVYGGYMNFKKILTLDALFEGGRMFVGATSVTYLLQSGLTISQIGILKTIQAITILIGEYPTGLIADFFGRKKSLYLSLIAAITGFLIFAFGYSFYQFILAEILCALSLCLWSGAYEAYAIEAANLEKQEGLMDKFFHTNQSLNSAFVLVFGTVGGMIAEKTLNLPYIAGSVTLLIGYICLCYSPSENFVTSMEIKKKSIIALLKNSISEGIGNQKIIPFIFISVAIQFSIQPLLHLWQPYFAELRGLTSTSFNSVVFGFYCIMNIIAGLVAAKYSKKIWFRTQAFFILSMVVFSVLYILTSIITSGFIVLILFGLTQAFLSIFRTNLSIKLNQNISSQSRASILSSISLFSRFGMLAALQWIQIMSHQSQSTQTIFSFFSIITSFMVALFTLGILIKITINKKEIKNEITL